MIRLRLVRTGLRVAALAVGVLMRVGTLHAAVPPSATITATDTMKTYVSGPFTGSNPTANALAEPACNTPNSCDDFDLTVDVPANYPALHPNAYLTFKIAWPNSTNDFDLYVQNPTTGLTIQSSASSADPEVVVLPVQGGITRYRVRVSVYLAANESFTGTCTLGPLSDAPTREGLYRASTDVFTCNTHLAGQGPVFDHGGDGEPAVKFDADGNTWITGITGVGGGIGLWKVAAADACAQNPLFLNQPDAGVGGGDTDIAIATVRNALGFYNIYTSSLYLANITSSTSVDGGATFVQSFLSTPFPVNDRQWNAAYGQNTVYLSWREGATQPGNTLLVTRSSAAGAPGTFTGGFPVWTSPGVSDLTQGKELGNMTTDRRPGGNELSLTAGSDGQGNVYHGFVQNSNEVWVAVSRDFGTTWTSSKVFQGGAAASFDHKFTWVAVDQVGNVYTAWSDDHSIFYSASQDFKTSNTPTWISPVRVNNGTQVKTCLLPALAAGSAGRIVLGFYGSSASGASDPSAVWNYFHVRCNNAFDAVPTLEQVQVNDHVMHTGVVCEDGLNCACCRELLENQMLDIDPRDGSTLLSYAGGGGIFITKQVAGVSALASGMIVDNSLTCPTLLRPCTGQSVTESRCILPGLTVATDASGDFNALDGNNQQDIQHAWIAEPDLGSGDTLVISLKVATLGPTTAQLPANTLWTVLWDNPVPGDPFPRKFVQMNTCDPLASPSFAYGHVSGSLQQADGDPDGGGIWMPDGTIRIKISRRLAGSPQPNQVLGNVTAETRFLVGTLCSGLIQTIDTATGTTYVVKGNGYCRTQTVACAAFPMPQGPGDYPLSYTVYNPSTTARTFHVTLSDNNAWIVGSPVVQDLGPIAAGGSLALNATLRIANDCMPTPNDVVRFRATASDLSAAAQCSTLASCTLPTSAAGVHVAAQSNGGGVDLVWTADPAAGLVAFNVYRGPSLAGPFERLNAEPIAARSEGEMRFHDIPQDKGTYIYRLAGLTREGGERVLEVLSAEFGQLPRTFAFSQAGRTPFGSGTTLSYALPTAERVRIELFTVTGQKVGTIVDEHKPAGTYAVPLNLRDRDRSLSAGVYMIRFTAGTEVRTLRVVGLH